jgi:cytochrome P450
MGMAQYAVFRSPWNFYDPESYIPERWFSDDPKFANDKREALQPFSFGPRNCIGTFALAKERIAPKY